MTETQTFGAPIRRCRPQRTSPLTGRLAALARHSAYLFRGRTSSAYAARPRGAHAGPPRRERLWHLLQTEDYVAALGALTGNQAVQMIKAGLQAIYLSGWQVAADANLAGHTYPDQSLYPANSVPAVVRRINNALLRADEIA